MLARLIEQADKPIKQEVAAAAMERGTFIENGNFVVDVPKNYDGINAVVDPKYTDSDTIAIGDTYNKIPVVMGERYATTELTVGTLTDGDGLTLTSGLLVAAASAAKYHLVYRGTYANPYGVTMYAVEVVPEATAT